MAKENRIISFKEFGPRSMIRDEVVMVEMSSPLSLAMLVAGSPLPLVVSCARKGSVRRKSGKARKFESCS